jgi:hypothetical protein
VCHCEICVPGRIEYLKYYEYSISLPEKLATTYIGLRSTRKSNNIVIETTSTENSWTPEEKMERPGTARKLKKVRKAS